MKIATTGSTGFVGGHLNKLLQDHELINIVRNLKKATRKNIQGKLIVGNLKKESIKKWVNDLPEDLDAFIHVASLVHTFNKQDFFESNSKATAELIDALKKKYSGKKLKFLLISSMAALGPTGTNDKPTPVSAYGESKLLQEDELINHAPHEWSKTIIRPPMVLGSGDDATMELVKMAKSGFILTPGMNGTEKRYAYVDVRDLAEIIKKGVELDNCDPVSVNVASGPSFSYRKLNETVALIVGKKVKFIKVPIPILILISFIATFINNFVKLNFRVTKDKINEIIPDSWANYEDEANTKLGHKYQYNLKDSFDFIKKS